MSRDDRKLMQSGQSIRGICVLLHVSANCSGRACPCDYAWEETAQRKRTWQICVANHWEAANAGGPKPSKFSKSITLTETI